MWLSRGGKGVRKRRILQKLVSDLNLTSFLFFFIILDNFYKVEGAKDALICGNSSDAG